MDLTKDLTKDLTSPRLMYLKAALFVLCGSIELCEPGYAEFASLSDGKATRKIVEDHGLKCVSSHFTMKSLRSDQPKVIEWAKDVGMSQMCTASLGGRMQNGIATMDAVKQAADEYNKIGAEAAKAGLQQVLHDEGFEMSKLEDGRLTYQVLLAPDFTGPPPKLTRGHLFHVSNGEILRLGTRPSS